MSDPSADEVPRAIVRRLAELERRLANLEIAFELVELGRERE